MKRFRVLGFDLDRRALALTIEEQEHWDEQAKEFHRKNQHAIKWPLQVEQREPRQHQHRPQATPLVLWMHQPEA